MTARSLPRAAAVLRDAWRTLRTMRTAIILLLLLGAGASVGSLFPQRPINPVTVAEWIARNPRWAPIAERLGLFDVYGSWWFMGIYALLLVSLVGCIAPRFRAYARGLRSRPRHVEALNAQQRYTAGTVALPPAVALESAERVLRAKRFRISRTDGTIAGDKGHFREAGSLLFHSAFLVLLVGMSIGKLFGFSAQTAVIEGERFTDTHVDYDSISEGRFFNERHRGFAVALDRFDVDWHPNGTPKHFVSSVRLLEDDRVVRRETIRVNHPLTYRGVQIYQLSWGWAPEIRVKQNGRVLYDGATVFLPRAGAWHGVAKIPQARPQQAGLDFFFYANPVLGADGVPREATPPAPRNPLLIAQLHLGDLNLDVPQSVYTLDMRSLTPVGEVVAMRPGDTEQMANGIEVSFLGLRRYSVFQVASNPGAPILLVGAVLMLVGLVPALYSSRRRVWVRAQPLGSAARLEIAGHALQRKAAFEEEFETLVRDLDRDLYARTRTTRTGDERVGVRDG